MRSAVDARCATGRRGKNTHTHTICVARRADFLAIPELVINPLGLRVIAVFDSTRQDQVNFKQFCHTLSMFRPDASVEQKLDREQQQQRVRVRAN